MGFYCSVAVAVIVVAMLTPTSRSQDVRTGQCCGSCVSGPQGLPGVPGNNGFNGRDGAKGVRGEQGPVGGDGAKGDRGEQGPVGGDGAKGDRGEQGLVGGDGAKGDRGEKGETGSPGTAARARVKQCFWKNLNDEADSGKIVDCQFNKASSTTALRLTWNGDLRYTGSSAGCMRWYFTVNGQECSNPAPIDGVVHTPGANIHRVSTIDGLCYNLPAGPLTVAFNVGTCSGYGVGNAQTGWNSYSRVILEELDMAD